MDLPFQVTDPSAFFFITLFLFCVFSILTIIMSWGFSFLVFYIWCSVGLLCFFKSIIDIHWVISVSLPLWYSLSTWSIPLVKRSTRFLLGLLSFSCSLLFQFGFSSACLPFSWINFFISLSFLLFFWTMYLSCLSIMIILWILLRGHSYAISNFRRWHVVVVFVCGLLLFLPWDLYIWNSLLI